MNKSESINELAMALSKLQGEIFDAHKNNQGYGYKYADLGSVLEIARPLLQRHGLSVTQLCGNIGDKISLETVLMHSSGQWISETLAFDLPEPIVTKDGKKKNSKAQDCGSMITYMRRYSLTALLGITQTDDDASLHKPDAQPEQQQAPEPVAPAEPAPPQLITVPTYKELQGYIASQEISEERVNEWLKYGKVNTLEALPEKIALAILSKCREAENNIRQVEADSTQWEDTDGV